MGLERATATFRSHVTGRSRPRLIIISCFSLGQLSDLLLKSCDVSTLALTATLLVLPDALEMLRLCSVVSD
jgi:hypothetical protein